MFGILSCKTYHLADALKTAPANTTYTNNAPEHSNIAAGTAFMAVAAFLMLIISIICVVSLLKAVAYLALVFLVSYQIINILTKQYNNILAVTYVGK